MATATFGFKRRFNYNIPSSPFNLQLTSNLTNTQLFSSWNNDSKAASNIVLFSNTSYTTTSNTQGSNAFSGPSYILSNSKIYTVFVKPYNSTGNPGATSSNIFTYYSAPSVPALINVACSNQNQFFVTWSNGDYITGNILSFSGPSATGQFTSNYSVNSSNNTIQTSNYFITNLLQNSNYIVRVTPSNGYYIGTSSNATVVA